MSSTEMPQRYQESGIPATRTTCKKG